MLLNILLANPKMSPEAQPLQLKDFKVIMSGCCHISLPFTFPLEKIMLISCRVFRVKMGQGDPAFLTFSNNPVWSDSLSKLLASSMCYISIIVI